MSPSLMKLDNTKEAIADMLELYKEACDLLVKYSSSNVLGKLRRNASGFEGWILSRGNAGLQERRDSKNKNFFQKSAEDFWLVHKTRNLENGIADR